MAAQLLMSSFYDKWERRHENSRLFCESFINTFFCKGLNHFEKEIVTTNTRSDIFFIWNFWALVLQENRWESLSTENDQRESPETCMAHKT